MDGAGIDRAVLSCGQGYDGDLETRKLVNLRIKEAGDNYNSRFIGLVHLAGGFGWYLPRLRTHLEDKEFWGIQDSPEHGRLPEHDITWYMENRMMFDTASWSGPTDTAARAVHWIRHGLMDIPAPRMVFATDFPQAVGDTGAIRDYVNGVKALAPMARPYCRVMWGV